MNTLVTVAAVVMTPGVSLDRTEPRLPTGPAPVVRTARLDWAGRVLVKDHQAPVVLAPLDGADRDIDIGLTVHELKDVRVYNTQGMKVDPRELPRLLEKMVPVLVSSDGRGVDPLYLRHAKPGTLVLILPRVQPKPNRPVNQPVYFERALGGVGP